MKKYILILIILFANTANADDVSFSDINFKNKLLSANTINNIALNQSGVSIVIDVDGNNEISDIEALAVYQLNVSNSDPSIISVQGVESFINLQILNCQNNSIITADLSGMLSLTQLNISSNFLDSLNLTGCIALTSLNINSNSSLATIDFSSLVELTSVQAANCNFSAVDVSWCFHLTDINFSNNSLASMNVKNGVNEIIDISGISNNNLTYICADENQIATIEASVTSLPNCNVNSYCTFPPGGNYNKVVGQAVFDLIGNGIDVTDSPQQYLKLSSVFEGQNLSTTTNSQGEFAINIQDIGSYTLVPNIENPTWFSIIPSIGTFISTDNNILSSSFNIVPVGIHQDVEVVVTPLQTAQPGLQATYMVVYKNKGNQDRSGIVNLTFDESLLTFESATTSLDLNSNSLLLTYLDLKPFESRSYTVTFNVSSSAIINSILNFNATIDTSGESSDQQQDNSFTYRDKVTNSNNANSIKCLEGENLDPSEIGNYLHYQIYFENTGTETANNIIIKHVVDETLYDYSTLQVLKTSHEMKMKSKNNVHEYFFQDANIGGPGGQGGILLKIKSNPNLQAGDVVNKSVSIYFDYKNPLTTNNETSTYQLLGLNESQFDTTIHVYPNPSDGIVYIGSEYSITTIQLYDINGRLLQTDLTNELKASIDVSQRQSGIYFLKIFSEKGVKVEKLVKE